MRYRFQEGGGTEIEDSLFSMNFDDLDVFWIVSDRVMKSRWRTMKSPGWVMKSGVFRYVCIFCMSNCKNIVRDGDRRFAFFDGF